MVAALANENVPASSLYHEPAGEERDYTDLHAYPAWTPLLQRRTWSSAGGPWRWHPRDVEYPPDACPATIDLLRRAVHVDVSPDLSPRQVEQAADADRRRGRSTGLSVTEEYDAIVVGAGAAGCWAAKELTERGLRVLLLEAGRPLDRGDFPTPAPPEARLRSRVSALVGGQGIQMRCAAFSARTRAFFVRDRDHPYATPAGEPFNWFRGRQVGGRLPVWARVVPRALLARAASRDAGRPRRRLAAGARGAGALL